MLVMLYIEMFSAQNKFSINGLVTILKIQIDVTHPKVVKAKIESNAPITNIKCGFKASKTATTYKWVDENMVFSKFEDAKKILKSKGVLFNNKKSKDETQSTDYEFLSI